MSGTCGAGLLAGFVVLLGFLTREGSSSISCYQCNSFYDPRCGDPFDPYTLGSVNCSMREPFEHVPQKEAVLCRKIVQKVQGQTRIVRGCGYVENDPPRDEKICMRRVGTHDVQVHYCACVGDLCNAAPTAARPSAVAVLATAALAAAALVRAGGGL